MDILTPRHLRLTIYFRKVFDLIGSTSLKRFFWSGEFFVFMLAFIVRLSFWWYTNWAIEDGMIIARMVKNLVEFGRFSFNINTIVSSSTSPIFALMASAIAAIGIPPLDSAKILGAIASSITAVLIYKILYDLNVDLGKEGKAKQLKSLSSVTGSLTFIFLPPVISYSVSGLETAVYALLCAFTLERLTHLRNPSAQRLAIWLGSFTALFRPDGAIILAVVILVQLWAGFRTPRKTLLNFWPILLVIPAGILLHQLYFGVPIPQSFFAKASGYEIDILRNARRYLHQMLFAQAGSLFIYFLGLIGVIWAAHRAPRLLIFIMWYVLYHALFIMRAPLFDWYLQVPLFVLCLFSAIGLLSFSEIFTNRIHSNHRISWLLPSMGMGLGMILVVALLSYAGGRRLNQSYSVAVLEAVGNWLTNNTPRDALVFTESLGYIGFASHNEFVDWPGLASPGVPQLLENNGVQKDRKQAYDVIISSYRPDYLALRVNEWNSLDMSIKNKYSICKAFPSTSKEEFNSYLIAGFICP